MTLKRYTVDLYWDAEAYVWMAISEDVPGLVLESEDKDVLIEQVKLAVPDLLEINGVYDKPYTIRFLHRAGAPPF